MPFNNVPVDFHAVVEPEVGTNQVALRSIGQYIGSEELLGKIQGIRFPRIQMEGTEYAHLYFTGFYPSRFPLLTADLSLNAYDDWFESHQGPGMIHTYRLNKALSNVAAATNTANAEDRHVVRVRGYVMGMEPGEETKENPAPVARYMVFPTHFIKEYHLREAGTPRGPGLPNLPVSVDGTPSRRPLGEGPVLQQGHEIRKAGILAKPQPRRSRQQSRSVSKPALGAGLGRLRCVRKAWNTRSSRRATGSPR